MNDLKPFDNLFLKVEVLSEDAQGQLKGGFALFTGGDLGLDPGLEDPTNNCTNNCRCKNKNRRDCSGCSNTSTSTGS